MSSVEHCTTGIVGLDEVTAGGLPRGRTTLIAGGPGCGKTLLALEFLVRGTEQGEPGVLVAFEESADEIRANAMSLGWDLEALESEGMLVLDHVKVEREQIEQTGDYSLDGLFVRLGFAVDRVQAKRVVIDTIEVLFSALDDTAVLRAELRRLFRWLKDRGLTAIVTGERSASNLTRNGLEEYVSDCVILLDHRVNDQLATRRMRIVKFRGSPHTTSELPFLIGPDGFSVVPVGAFDLSHPASIETVSSGIPALDAMLGLNGWYRGSTVMVSGSSGTGKTTFAAHFVAAACERGERSLFLAFEEGEGQISRNMRSAGVDLSHWAEAGLLRVHSSRPTQGGLENHLTQLHQQVQAFEPDVVVIDPITDFHSLGSSIDIKAMLMRMIDFLKQRQVTAVLTSLISEHEREDVAVSSLIDSWLQLSHVQEGSSRSRALYILKARGMSHSSEVRRYEITSSGVVIRGAVEDEREGRTSMSASSSRPDQDIETGQDDGTWHLRLYVAGETPRSASALANLRRICEEHLAGRYTIEVVDLLQRPQLAQGEQIVAIPTLERRLPPPVRKIIGDLSNTERVLIGLDLLPQG